MFNKAGSTERFLPAFGSMDCKEACQFSGDLTQGRRSFFFLEKTQAGAWLVIGTDRMTSGHRRQGGEVTGGVVTKTQQVGELIVKGGRVNSIQDFMCSW